MSQIEVEKIVLRSPNGKNSITLEARDDVVGIWLNKEDKKHGRYIALVYDESAPFFAISNQSDGLPTLAIAIDDENTPYFQVSQDGKKVDLYDLEYLE